MHAVHLQVFEICGQVQRVDRIGLRYAWKYALIPYGLPAQVMNNRLFPVDMKFVLLHESRNDDGIKAFFSDVWELYVKVSSTASS